MAEFVEKPEIQDRPRSFVATGQYLWNAGMYHRSGQAVARGFGQDSAVSLHAGVMRIGRALGH